MPIIFDIIGNDKGVVKTFEDIQASVKKTASVIEDLGNYGLEIDGLVKQVVALKTAIRDNEKAIETSKEKLKSFAEESRNALNAGDFTTFNAKQLDFTNELENLKELIENTEGYKKALEDLAGAKGLVEQTKVPLFFADEEEFNNIKELRERIVELQEELGNFNGSDEELYKLREALSDANDDLRDAEEAASEAAEALGPKLGEKAAETSTRLYEINAAVEKQEAVVEELTDKYNEAIEAVEALEGSNDVQAREKALSDYEMLAQQLHNAQNELTNLTNAQEQAQQEWERTSEEIDRQNSIITKLCGGQDKLNEILSRLPGPLQEAIRGLQGMTGAAKAFIATPLGIVLAALILAWQTLTTWFESSKEGQLAFAEASGYVSGVLNQLKEIAIAVGKALYTAFTEPQKAGKAFVSFLKDQIVNRLKAVGLIGKSVGNILYNAFTFNLDGLKQGAKDLANAVGQFAVGIEKPVTKAKNAIEGLHKAASENAKISVETKELDMQVSEWKKRKAELDKTIAEARTKMYNSSLSNAERKKALKDYRDAVKEQTDTEAKFAAKRTELQKRSMALTSNKIEDYEKLNALEAEEIQIQARGQRQLASLQRSANRINNGGAKSAKEEADRRAKEKANEIKHADEMVKLEQEAARAREDASIAAIQSQAQRERAVREAQHKRNIEDIKKQEGEIYKKIYEERKKAYENANKGKHYELTEDGVKGWQGVKKSSLTADEKKYYDERYSIIESELKKEEAEWNRHNADIAKQEIQSMRDYLKQYGTFQEQRLALAQEYAEKIAEAQAAGNKWEVKRLEAERNSSIAQANAQSLAMNIDWHQTFSGLGNVLEDIAKETLQKVTDYMGTAEFKGLDAAAKKAYQDLEKTLIEAGGLKASNPFSKQTWEEISDITKQYQFHVKALADATEMQKSAVTAYNNAVDKQTQAQTDLANAEKELLKHAGEEDERQYQAAVDKAKENLANATEEVATTFQQVTDSGEVMKTEQANVTNTQQQLHRRTDEVSQGLRNFNTVVSQITSGSLVGFADGISNIIMAITGSKHQMEGLSGIFGDTGKQIGGIIGAILSIIDMIGDKPVEFFDNLFDGITKVIEAVISHIPQIILSVLKGVGNIVTGIGKGIVELFAGDVFGSDNSEEQAKKQEEIRSEIESATYAINKLTEALEKSYGSNAMQNAKELWEKYTAQAASQISGLNEALWDNYGGGHSDYYHWEKNSKDLARMIGQRYGLEANDWWSLFNNNDASKVAEALRDIRENEAEWWRILTTQGYNEGAVKEWLEALIETADNIDAATDRLNEQLTTTTADNVLNDLLENLYNIADGSEDVMEDIAENWQKMVNRMVVNNMVMKDFEDFLNGNVEKGIEGWYDQLAKLNQQYAQGLIDEEKYKEGLAFLKQEYDNAVDYGQRKIAELTEKGFITPLGEAADKAKKYFENLLDSWKSTLTNMSATTEDWKNELIDQILGDLVESTILNAPLTVMIDNAEKEFKDFNAYLEDWTARYKAIIEDQTLTDEERNAALKALIAEQTDIRDAQYQKSKEMAEGIGKNVSDAFSNSLDNLGDTLLDSLLDAEKDAGDMGKQIASTLIQEMIKEMLASEKYANRMADIREKWQNVLKGKNVDEAGNTLYTIDTILQDIAELNSDIAQDEDIKVLAERYKEVKKEIENSQSSFGDLHDTFMTAITDMEGGIENFRRKLRETMTRDLIDKAAFEGFDEFQDDWTKRYLQALKDGDRELLDLLLNELEEREQAMAESVEDLVKSLSQINADTTFTDMEDSFVSALTNMNGDIEDFSNTMKETIVRKLVESFMVSEQIKPMLKELQQTLDYVMAQDWTPEERARFMAGGGVGANGHKYLGIDNYENDMKAMSDTVQAFYTAVGYKTKETAKLFDDLVDRIAGSLTSSQSGAEDFVNALTASIVDEMTQAYMATDEFVQRLETVKTGLRDAAEQVKSASTPEEIAAATEQLKAAEQAAANLRDEVAGATESVRNLGKAMEQDTTFKDMDSELMSALQDTDAAFEDWGQTIGKKMADKIFDGMMKESRLLENIQDAWNDTVAKFTDQQTGKVNWKAVMNDEALAASVEAGKEEFEEFKEAWQNLCNALGVKMPEPELPFGNLRDRMLSSLTDLDMTAEDFGKQIALDLMNEMLSTLFDQRYADTIKRIREMWQHVLNGDKDGQGNMLYTLEDVEKEIDAFYASVNAPDHTLSDIGKKIQDLNRVIEESVPDNTFKGMSDAWTSALTDMEGTSADLGKQIGRTLVQKVVSELIVGRELQTYLDNIQAAYDEAVSADGATMESVVAAVTPHIEAAVQATERWKPAVDAIGKSLYGVEEQAKEAFGGLGDRLVSSLMDADMTAEKFGKEIAKTLVEQMLKQIVESQFAERMEDIQKRWAEALKNNDRDAIQSIKQDIVDLQNAVAEETCELTDSVKEIIEETDKTFSGMSDSWVSALMDMEKTAEDWAKDVGRIMAQRIIEQLIVPTKLQPLLDKIQEAMDAALSVEGATWVSAVAAMQPLLAEITDAYAELQPITESILNSFGIYREVADEVQEAVEEVKYALDDMEGDFVSALMRMGDEAGDFGQDISKKMAEAFIRNFVLGDAFQLQKERWQQEFESILTGGMSEEERARQLKQLRDTIVAAEQGYEEQANAVKALFGLNTSDDARATMSGLDKLTAEQGDVIVGLGTSLVIGQNEGNALLSQILATLGGKADIAAYRTTEAGAGIVNGDQQDYAKQILVTLQGMAALTQPRSDTLEKMYPYVVASEAHLADIMRTNRDMLEQVIRVVSNTSNLKNL